MQPSSSEAGCIGVQRRFRVINSVPLLLISADYVRQSGRAADTGRGMDLLSRRLANFEFCPHM